MRWVRYGIWAVLIGLAPLMALGAPYAALVMDARTGEVLYEKNADTRLHPASLTKMMTLYIAFEAVERGEISLDSMITVSANAAKQPPSRLGLKAGQKIALRYLIRAAAIKSANDAASAIGDAIGGDEAAFAARMNRTAKALGMRNTSFRNANGLTRDGHLSTARDMTLLGRRLFYDFPQYYNIFSRRTADAGMAKVANTNRRFLDAYEGADGIKTGYTSAAGFNLTASAQRGQKRVIATVFGGTSTPQRNAKMAELLDIGFGRAPGRVKEVKPTAPQYVAEAPSTSSDSRASGKTIRVVAAPARSPRPLARPGVASHDADAIALALASAQAAVASATPAEPAPQAPAVAEAAPAGETVLAAAEVAPLPRPEDLAPEAVAVAEAAPAAAPEPEAPAVIVASADIPRPVPAPRPAAAAVEAPADTPAPAPAETFAQQTEPQPETLVLAEAAAYDDALAEGDASEPGPVFEQVSAPQPETLAMAAAPETMILAALTPPAPAPRAEPEVVARISSSGGRHWGVSLGKFGSMYQAESVLLKTALMESDALGDALRKVTKRKTGFEATFVGLSKQGAELACARLSARATDCDVIGP